MDLSLTRWFWEFKAMHFYQKNETSFKKNFLAFLMQCDILFIIQL